MSEGTVTHRNSNESDDPRAPVISAAFADRSRLTEAASTLRSVLDDLDAGRLRVASPPNHATDEPGQPGPSIQGTDEPGQPGPPIQWTDKPGHPGPSIQGTDEPGQPDGEWTVHAWLQQAVVLAFALFELRPISGGDLLWHDRLPPKRLGPESGVRSVPPGVARYGSHLEPGVILMPGFVNIGARVGRGTMIDTWATVGSCAQIGRDVHLAGGVGIGGVLEPPGARPVIVEDGAFLGSRCIVVEGVRVGREAVLGANVVLTASTPIIDVTGTEERVLRGYVPPRSVVVPGTRPRTFPAGTYHLPCALIVGQRSESTDRKTSLNAALRAYDVSA